MILAKFVEIDKTPKKELGQYQALLTEQVKSVNYLLHCQENCILARPKAGYPAGARYLTLTLPTWAADQNIGFAIILPARRISQ